MKASWCSRTLAKSNTWACGLIRRDKDHTCIFERALDSHERVHHNSETVFKSAHGVGGQPKPARPRCLRFASGCREQGRRGIQTPISDKTDPFVRRDIHVGESAHERSRR